jgi:signal transduction histidine kinase
MDSLPSNTGLGQWVIEHNEPLIVSNVASDPRTAEISYTGSLQTYVCLPMRARGQAMGILSILKEATQPEFNLEEIALLTSIADQVGMVVESARLRERAEQAAITEERARLARELHDAVTQSLYSVTLLADAGEKLAEAGDLEQAKGYMVRLGEVAQHALKEMRLLIYELRPSALEQVGLVEALRQRLETVEKRANIAVEITADELADLPLPVEQELYQIAQETLNNALKHAQATSVTVHISTSGEQVTLAIRDNGRGFDLEAVEQSGGLGLSTMYERTKKIGGRFEVITAPGTGTQVIIAVNC